ncbi:MAG: glucokinase [Deltaproteobacteria bacterium]|nr:glucokinase [Deltaproteobacteria bacterium]
MILAGDVGGTKTRLAFYILENGKLKRQDIERYESKAFSGLQDIIDSFLSTRSFKVEAACFGVPGPVIEGHVKLPNLPWELDEQDLMAHLKVKNLRLVNDLVATAAAVPHLDPSNLISLSAGKPQGKPRVFAVVAPGTGLGHAYLYHEDGKYHVIASEAGHMDFAPTNDTQFALLKYLQEKYKRVSVERVVCGPGLKNIYDFLRDTGRGEETEALRARFEKEDPGAVIANCGMERSADICVQALDIFISVLGSHAGNVVLMTLATGGLYLGGGIPPKIAKKLNDPLFFQNFTDKGRFVDVVGSTPINIIADDHAAVVGAASIASQLLGSIRIRTSS